MNNQIEDLRKELNLKIRELLKIMDFIDCNDKDYRNGNENMLDETNYLKKQIDLVNEVKVRLMNIFRD